MIGQSLYTAGKPANIIYRWIVYYHLSSVFSSGGCGRTGTYIAVSILIERLKTEGVVDAFHTVRNLRLQRPGMVQSEVIHRSIAIRNDDIILCYHFLRLSWSFVTKQHSSIWSLLNFMITSSSFF